MSSAWTLSRGCRSLGISGSFFFGFATWSVRISPQKLWDFDGLFQNDTRWNPQREFPSRFQRTSSSVPSINQSMERYRGINQQTNGRASGSINTSQRLLLTASVDNGDQIRFITSPFLGRLLDYSLTALPAAFAPSIGPRTGWQQIPGPREPRPGIQRQVIACRDDVSILAAPADPERRRGRCGTGIQREVVRKHPPHVSCEFGRRLLSGIRRPLQRRHRGQLEDFFGPDISTDQRAVFTKIQYLFRTGGAS